MTLAKDYEIAAVEMTPADGVAFVALLLCVTEDGVIMSGTNHRFAIPADMDWPDALDMMDAALVAMGYPALTLEDAESVYAIREAALSNPGKPKLTRAAPPPMGPAFTPPA